MKSQSTSHSRPQWPVPAGSSSHFPFPIVPRIRKQNFVPCSVDRSAPRVLPCLPENGFREGQVKQQRNACGPEGTRGLSRFHFVHISNKLLQPTLSPEVLTSSMYAISPKIYEVEDAGQIWTFSQLAEMEDQTF